MHKTMPIADPVIHAPIFHTRNASMIRNRTVSRHQSRGQGMTEYIIIVALIAVAAIGVYSYFGKTVRNQTAGMANELAGESSKSSISEAKKAAEEANKQAKQEKDLGSYNSK